MLFFSSSSAQHINNWVCLLGAINILGFSAQKVKSFGNRRSHSHEPNTKTCTATRWILLWGIKTVTATVPKQSTKNLHFFHSCT